LKKKLKDPGPLLKVGTRVKINPPNLWRGMDGVIEGHTDEFQVVRVTRFDGSSFQVGARRAEMEVVGQPK
jgi:hypothetical protein